MNTRLSGIHMGISTMTLQGLNLLSVLLASLVSIISGAIWFGPKTFYPIWMKARGIESGQLSKAPNPLILFGGTFLAVVVQTFTLGVFINSLRHNGVEFSALDGATTGFLLGLGIGAFASLPHRLFGGESFKVWIIETSNDVLNLAIAGAIISALS